MPTIAHGVSGQFSPILSAPASYNFGVEGGDWQLDISTDARNVWTLTEYVDWLSESPDTSMGKTFSIVTCEQQIDGGDARNTTITITSSSPAQYVDITQDASVRPDYITVTGFAYFNYYDGIRAGSTLYTIESNVSWEIPSVDQSEITAASIGPMTGSAGTTNVYVACNGDNLDSVAHWSSSQVRDVATGLITSYIDFCQDALGNQCGS